jgi:hypothetical protein
MKTIDSFTIQTEPNIKLLFDSPEYNQEGLLEKYQVSIFSKGLSVKLKADNPPYGHSPYKLFEQIANDWRGWNGEKGWGAMEGEYSLTATFAKTGHITLEEYNLWTVTAKIDIEAGQIENLAKKAKKFFGW